MLNKVLIMGRIVRPIELKSTKSGTAVSTFTIASDSDYKNQDGERRTEFIDVTVWNKLAEFVNRNLVKGQQIVVEGSLASNSWADNNGNRRISYYVNCSNIYFAGAKPESEFGTQEDAFEEIQDGNLPF